MTYGLLFGYKLSPGMRWIGKYLCVDLDDFIGIDLSHDAPCLPLLSARHCKRMEIYGDHNSGEIVFPLQEKYEWFNNTLGGRE